MAEVVSVRFRGGSKTYYFDPRDLHVETDQFVIVETAQGIEYARCVEGNHEVPDQSVVQPLRPVVRVATEQDDKTAANNRKREKEAFAICEKKIAAHKLDMKLVSVECSFEGNKIIFFFTAEGRVDFRELVKDLASVFRARIELRQIGVRDGAKMLGGLGICGRPLCCSQFLDEFIPVSIKMAKTQNLSLNPTKISGTCGRLMCCLKYEQNAYEDAAKRMPKNDSFVNTPDGVGNVTSVDLLREEATVRLDTAPESPKKYKCCEMCVLRNGKGSREGIEIPKERPQRYEPPMEESMQIESRLSSDWMPSVPDTAAKSSAPAASQSQQQEERSHNSRRHRRGGHRSGERSPEAQEEKRQETPKPQREPKPREEKKPNEEKKPHEEKKGQRPQKQEQRPRNERRPQQQKPRNPQHQKEARAPKADAVEKVQIRPTGDTTAELKAAADRAARRQQNQSQNQNPEGQAPKAKEGKPHRRPRYRPRKKPDGGSKTE